MSKANSRSIATNRRSSASRRVNSGPVRHPLSLSTSPRPAPTGRLHARPTTQSARATWRCAPRWSSAARPRLLSIPSGLRRSTRERLNWPAPWTSRKRRPALYYCASVDRSAAIQACCLPPSLEQGARRGPALGRRLCGGRRRGHRARLAYAAARRRGCGTRQGSLALTPSREQRARPLTASKSAAYLEDAVACCLRAPLRF